MAEQLDCVVIGAGHAGLAASHLLSARSIDHVVLERGEVANSWTTERWDSLRLLTPSRHTRLPGAAYDGADPDGFQSAAELAAFLQRYAGGLAAPVRTGVAVTSLRRTAEGYVLGTTDGELRCRTVVIASGACNLPSVPALAAGVPEHLVQLSAHAYRRPDQLPEGGVLVVGASATGVQLAAELQRSGRQVVLSVGEHVRLPRTYRGRDVVWWMEASGVWAQRYDELDDLERARALPSPQLVGTPERVTLDLNALTDLGVGVVGRWAAVRDGTALFSGGLRNLVALADLKQQRLLDGFDAWARTHGYDDGTPPERPEPTRVPQPSRLRLDLTGPEVRSVLWATGYRPDYSWLDVPVLDARGRLRHDGGVVDSPGLYALALPVLRRRGSTFIHGIEDDARDVVAHLAAHLRGRSRQGSAATLRRHGGEQGPPGGRQTA